MARKKLYTKALALLVTEEVHGKIMDLCDEQELSFSEWIREAIDLKLAQENTTE